MKTCENLFCRFLHPEGIKRMLLADRVAIVTGSAKGMGRAIALKFAREGCSVVVADLDLHGAENVAKEITALGGKAAAQKVDITKQSEVDALAAQTMQQFGRIDILVNNAGVVSGSEGTIDTVTEELWNKVLDVNLKGAFLVSKAVVPHMKAQKYGKIIFISSMGAVNPSVSVLHYHSAKAGLLGLAKNLAFELAPYSIYVNSIVPGPVDTPFWDSLLVGMNEEERQAFFAALAKKEVPLGRVGKPDDIAGPALFLASGLSDFVTGEVIHAAGGQPLLAQSASFIANADM